MAEALCEAANLVAAGYTQREAAKMAGVSQPSLCKYMQERAMDDGLRALARECEAVVAKAYAGRVAGCEVPNVKFPCRVVFMDDLHTPFTDFDVVRKVVERERGADLLVTFELVNFDAFARFDQTYLCPPTLDEDVATRLVSLLAGQFGRVVCGTSNHVDRPIRALARMARPEQLEYFKERLRTFADTIKALGVVQIQDTFVQIGDAVFCHFDRALITPGKTPERALNRVRAYGDLFGIKDDVRAVFTGHTHRVSQTPMPGGRGYLYEVGCGTYVPPYALDHAKGGGWAGYRMASGYGVAVFDEHGKIDLTESRAIHVGWARLPGRNDGGS